MLRVLDICQKSGVPLNTSLRFESLYIQQVFVDHHRHATLRPRSCRSSPVSISVPTTAQKCTKRFASGSRRRCCACLGNSFEFHARMSFHNSMGASPAIKKSPMIIPSSFVTVVSAGFVSLTSVSTKSDSEACLDTETFQTSWSQGFAHSELVLVVLQKKKTHRQCQPSPFRFWIDLLHCEMFQTLHISGNLTAFQRRYGTSSAARPGATSSRTSRPQQHTLFNARNSSEIETDNSKCTPAQSWRSRECQTNR